METVAGKMETLVKIVEGNTSMIIPKMAITEKAPPKEPAFFNPRAMLNRDLSIIAYSAFLDNFVGPRIFLDALAGVGARGLRVANELDVDAVMINDLNPSAIKMAKESAKINNITNVTFSENETCRFLSACSERGKRGAIVDVDPFGSPVQFLDCGLRATMYNGMLSCTATDQQVLNGLFQDACMRKYGGRPVRVEYGNEMAIRLILGCLGAIAGRLGMKVSPVFVESDMHYYRTYVVVSGKPDLEGNLGYILHCNACKHRKTSSQYESRCNLCGSEFSMAGPLWIGNIFEKKFIECMSKAACKLPVSDSCEKILAKVILESEMPGTYYTTDMVAAKIKSSPPKIDKIISDLQKIGFRASPTAFDPTGFRTDANIDEIARLF
ncbi:MAG: tRNA (guanine-N1)-methyltransferase [Thaumarchaeota archaeon]|nr:tRNA (guanine-N1)-methyltransferase [Nitrososphaerota archaeon]